jgi:restriction system protein
MLARLYAETIVEAFPCKMDIIFQYPPELLQLLVQTVPLLCRSKKDVLLFFRGAGMDFQFIEDLWDQVDQNRESISKYELTRIMLTRLNEKGEVTLRERREILKRVTEFEDFSTCWPEDQLKAKGLVSEVRRVVNVKDSFTRIQQERERERKDRTAEYQKQVAEAQKKKESLEAVKQELYHLFGMSDKRKRGLLLEKVLNRLFQIYGISIREAFALHEENGATVLEQVDGVVELDDEIYLVEMKWLQDAADVNDVSRHLIRIYHRGFARGIFISASGYTEPAVEICREALQRTVVTLCVLEEFVSLLEQEKDLKRLLKDKIHFAVIDKKPFKKL